MADAAGVPGARIGDRLSGGNANITSLIESDAGRMVLRHPPEAVVSDKAAAGIEREYRLMQAVGPAGPVPRAVAFCDDASVIGTPFLVIEYVDGVAITDVLPSAYADDEGSINSIGEHLIDGIAAIHNIDWTQGLANFGRPDGFAARQIDRWTKVRTDHAVRDLPLLGEIANWLRANAPAQARPAIIHCDYHLDNTLFDRAAPRLNAIIDWEMATVGDPRIDLGLVLMFWARDESAPLSFPFVQRVSNRPGVISREQLAERWGKTTGIDTGEIDYFRVFAFWRLAAIVEGAWVLQCKGEVDSAYAQELERDVPGLLNEAAAVIG